MKRVIPIVIFMLIVASGTKAQFFKKSDVEIYQDKVGKQAVELMKEHIELTDSQAKIFWPMYKEYRARLDSIFYKEISVLEEYLMHYYTLTPEKGKKLIEKGIEYKKDILDLQEEYVEKMAKVLPVEVFGRFYQIDSRINIMMHNQQSQKVPLIRSQKLK